MEEKIYQLLKSNNSIIETISKIIINFRSQNNDTALRATTLLTKQLDQSLDLLVEVTGQERVNYLLGDLEELIQTQQNKDYVLLSDLYELKLQKFFIELQEEIICCEGIVVKDFYYNENLELMQRNNYELYDEIAKGTLPWKLLDNEYVIEYSSSGSMTMALSDQMGRYYLHSNNKIHEAAHTLAASWYQEETTTYIVYGFGLGYHIKQLNEVDDNITIEVYDSDINILKLAAAYTDMRSILSNNKVCINYDPDYQKLLNRIAALKDNEKFVIHYPSLRNIKNPSIAQKMENYFIQYQAIENQRKLLNGNFRENIFLYDGFADELRDKFLQKDLYIVAAGPSLDKNFMLLKEVEGKGIILATGTVFKKLLQAGINPDYVIVTDANARVYRQIEGFENKEVPMLFLSTAYHGFARNYHGNKYIILQKDYEKAEQYANKHNKSLYQTGGSVSTTALDLGISLGCRRIIFLGLDLAYTDQYAHASDTSRREITITGDLLQTEDIYGKPVYTNRPMDMYRKWMEHRIQDIRDIEIIDATEGGAKIKGMRIGKLEDCIKG